MPTGRGVPRYRGPETSEEVLQEASKGLLAGVHLTISYRCKIDGLDMDDVLDHLRGSGAADVMEVKPMSRADLEAEGLY